MDYVVAGFGIGAIVALAGFALWELYGNVEQPGQTWLGRTAIGLMLGALVIWAVTAVTLISDIDDSTGWLLVLMTAAIALIAVAAGSFWYWRADRDLMVASGAPVRAEADVSSLEPALAYAASEATDWGSWPERVAPALAYDPEPEPSSEPVSFEAEVAAEPVALEILDEPSTEPVVAVDSDLEPASVADALPVEQPVVVAEEVEVQGTSEELDLTRIRAFRPRPRPDAGDALPEAGEDILVSEHAIIDVSDSAVVEETDVIVAAIEVDPEPLEEAIEVDPAAVEEEFDEAPAPFESSLLADIDATTAESDGRFTSPLLSDLESGEDELEGVGLAKWRSDARLVGDDRDEAPPAGKR